MNLIVINYKLQKMLYALGRILDTAPPRSWAGQNVEVQLIIRGWCFEFYDPKVRDGDQNMEEEASQARTIRVFEKTPSWYYLTNTKARNSARWFTVVLLRALLITSTNRDCWRAHKTSTNLMFRDYSHGGFPKIRSHHVIKVDQVRDQACKDDERSNVFWRRMWTER